MNTRFKDRLMTAGTVLMLCSIGVSLPGCSTAPPLGVVRSLNSTSTSTSNNNSSLASKCTTDFDCEMHEARGDRHREAPPRWKLWTGIGFGVIVTGYLLARRQDQGGDQRGGGIDVFTPGVNCDVAGRPGGGCAQ